MFLNVHVHALVLDGVFATDRAGVVRFHPTGDLTDLDVAEVLATLEPRVLRLLARRGFANRDEECSAPDAWTEDEPVLAGLAAASMQGTAALGRSRGARLQRLGDPPLENEEPPPGYCHAHSNGFDLHAGVLVPAGQRERLERVCRYALRPPVAADRVCVSADGQVRLDLRHRWADGTTHLVFDPVEFLGRLAVLVPRPRINLILYHGVLGPRAARRSQVVRHAAADATGDLLPATEPPPGPGDAPAVVRPTHGGGRLWADLMQRTFGFDVLACPRCGGRLRLVALIEQAAIIARILKHLGVPTDVPDPCAARAPPLPIELGGTSMDDSSAFDFGS